MKKKLFLFSILTFSFLYASKAEWNVYMYMEAGSYLHQAALKNLNDIAQYKPKKVNMYVLLHYQGATAMLYKIKKGIIKQKKEVSLGEKMVDAFVPLVKKIESKHPACNHCVILWNHGFGILVPRWNENEQDWEVVVDDPDYQECPLRSCPRNFEHYKHKGMLVNMTTKTCMDNDELILLCSQLKNIFGKKIDILGLDMCKGAMVEHAYQLKNDIDILIGSQECELTEGWPYDLLLLYLQKNPALAPRDFATAIIQSYEAFYQAHAPAGIYTQSALDVTRVEELQEKLDYIAEYLMELLDYGQMREVVEKVRKECRPFCDAPMYMDCYSFADGLLEALSHVEENETVQALKHACMRTKDCIQKMVIRNCAGPAISDDARGISIYAPRKTIDPSYVTVPFAQETKWFNFIKKFVQAA